MYPCILQLLLNCIEGNPFIIRFKTEDGTYLTTVPAISIEGNPFIIRFKTYSKSIQKGYRNKY